MTNKEILLSAIKRKETPRVPAILLTSGVWTASRFGYTLQDMFVRPPAEVAGHILDTYREINSDLIWTAADCSNIVLKALGAKTTFDISGGASTVDEPLIDSIADIEKLNIQDIENSADIQNLLAVTRLLKEGMRDSYLLGVSQWGPLTLAGQMIGIEKLMRLVKKDPSGVGRLLDFTEKVIVRYHRLFLQAGAELTCLSEPSASGDMISYKLFQTVVLSHLQSVFAQLHAEVKMLHICGNTSKILEYIPLTGADLYSFDYKVPVSEAAKILGGKIAFAGQLNPVSVMLEGTPEEVYRASADCIKAAGNTKGYILMPGCDLPPKTKVENVLAMVKAAHTINDKE